MMYTAHPIGISHSHIHSSPSQVRAWHCILTFLLRLLVVLVSMEQVGRAAIVIAVLVGGVCGSIASKILAPWCRWH
jgi:hypothetical protein